MKWVKVCDCVGATATTGKLRISATGGRDNYVTSTVDLIPGPSCDKCGKPWKREGLFWTSEKPTQSGWYWYRDRELFAIRPTFLLVEFDERGNPWIRMMGDFTRNNMTPVDSKFKGQWAGPLTPPEEGK